MPFPTTKTRIKTLADRVDCGFYQPKRVLAKYGYTQNKLAAELDVSTGTINNIFNGNPTIAQLKLIADTIGCSFYEFFQFSDDERGCSELKQNQAKCPVCGSVLGLCLE